MPFVQHYPDSAPWSQVWWAERQLVMDWVRFPELKLEPSHKQYARIAEQNYIYGRRDGCFEARIDVGRGRAGSRLPRRLAGSARVPKSH
jgi:hypothetical protein